MASVKPILTTDKIDYNSTEINEDSSCSSANNLESECGSFCKNDEEREYCESPRKCGRLKEPLLNRNDNADKLDEIGMLLSANESDNDQISNKTLDHGNGMK